MGSQNIKAELLRARDEYIDLIRAELMGPGSEFSTFGIENELISGSPLGRYSLGILFPQNSECFQNNDEIVPVNGKSLDETDETEDIEEYAEDKNEDKIKMPNKTKSYENDKTAYENLDEEIDMSSQYMPASMGITFLAVGDTEKINLSLEFATYRKALVTDCIIPYSIDNRETYKVPEELSHKILYDNKEHTLKLIAPVTPKEVRDLFEKDTIPENEAQKLKTYMYRFADCCRRGYVRIPHHVSNIVLDFSKSNYIDQNRNIDNTNAKITALREKIKNNLWSVTVMLVNNCTEEGIASPEKCLFQAKMCVTTEKNNFVFVGSESEQNPEYMDDEELSLELLYRNKKIYGTGLGTSVDWCIDKRGKGKLWSDFLPICEVPSMSFSLPQNSKILDEELSMKYLSDLDKTDKSVKINSLKTVVDLYSEWIQNLENISDTLDKRYKTTASKNIDECKKACERMYSGIQTLINDEKAYDAFMLTNRAMFMQRIQINKQVELSGTNSDRYPDDVEIADFLNGLDYNKELASKALWRPFQIAFLLMDINSIVFEDSEERNIVDLIWFPTGGGKTEAYLGLTAFTIFYRKLKYPDNSGGTAVMMRYTLRLLAAQQFTRAATLICACEYIRKDCYNKKSKHNKKSKYPKYDLGNAPITIGLWIGNEHIPNKNDGERGAKHYLENLKKAGNGHDLSSIKEKNNKFQVLKCPWCGTKMVKDFKDNKMVGSWGYEMKNGKHFYLHCTHQNCDFNVQLPIQIIDDELYSNPPTLLFGTVDKFAMLPWEGRIGSFFGIGSNNRSPELIIQDELHLISGALGTMVGLYETAIDKLSSHDNISTKIIASTATIRRAKEQCAALYNRKVAQFPAPGLNAEDSFFAREEAIDYSKEKYGRKYVGIMPSGKTKAMTEIRAMAALLERLYLMELSDEVKDKLWTLTVYFNSLKDLGKAFTLVEDDVKDFIVRTANRLFGDRRLIVNADELTSRVSTTELNETLDKLEKVEYSEQNKNDKKYASNILLATNMISVGIDVARLNAMLMVGQPKLTSEYIQASSRVGRSYPGVVFVQYDATKSRDRSHYERFKAYHDSFYLFVEPTGVTPFSKPARERALHAVLVAILRNLKNMKEDKDAKYFDKEKYAETIDDIKKFIVSRVTSINKIENSTLKNDVDEMTEEISDFFEMWQKLVDKTNEVDEGNGELFFGKKFMINGTKENEFRVLKPYFPKNSDYAKETLTSMRNVDSTVNGSIVIWEE